MIVSCLGLSVVFCGSVDGGDALLGQTWILMMDYIRIEYSQYISHDLLVASITWTRNVSIIAHPLVSSPISPNPDSESFFKFPPPPPRLFATNKSCVT